MSGAAISISCSSVVAMPRHRHRGADDVGVECPMLPPAPVLRARLPPERRAAVPRRRRAGGAVCFSARTRFSRSQRARMRATWSSREQSEMAAHRDIHLAKQSDHLVAGDPELACHVVYAKLAQTVLLAASNRVRSMPLSGGRLDECTNASRELWIDDSNRGRRFPSYRGAELGRRRVLRSSECVLLEASAQPCRGCCAMHPAQRPRAGAFPAAPRLGPAARRRLRAVRSSRFRAVGAACATSARSWFSI